MKTLIEMAGFGRGNPCPLDRGSALLDLNTWPSLVIECVKTRALRIIGPVRRWRNRRRAIRTLEALNDHYLMDLGIERSDIPFFVAYTQNNCDPQK